MCKLRLLNFQTQLFFFIFYRWAHGIAYDGKEHSNLCTHIQHCNNNNNNNNRRLFFIYLLFGWKHSLVGTRKATRGNSVKTTFELYL
jgi:hypothetical protein